MSGKTTSVRNLDPTKTFIISTTGKRPGIKGAKKKYLDFKITKDKDLIGNFYTTSDIDQIIKVIQLISSKMLNITTLIIDDFQYLQAFEAMARADEKGYGKFTDMAKHAYEALKACMNMREDLVVCILTHSENTGDNINPYLKIKTQGN